MSKMKINLILNFIIVLIKVDLDEILIDGGILLGDVMWILMSVFIIFIM